MRMARDASKRLLPKSPREVAQAVRIIRRYADGFGAKDGFDLRALSKQGSKALTKSQRQKLYRYFNTIAELESRPHQIIRPRNKKRLRAMQEFSRHTDFPKDLKVAFYPTEGKVKIRWSGNRPTQAVRLDTGEIITSLFFNMRQLVTNPDREIANTLGKANDDSFFYIMAGEHMIRRAFDKSGVTREILILMERYSGDHEDPNDPNSSFFGNWMLGLEVQQGLGFFEQRDKRRKEFAIREDYQRARTLARKERRGKRKMAKRLENELLRRLRNVNAWRAEQGMPLLDPDDFI